MAKDSDFKFQLFQSKDNEPSLFKVTATNLKLVVSNPPFSPKPKSPASCQPTPLHANFAVEVQERGIDVYEMSIKDPFHDLECDLTLDIEVSSDKKVVACHFPLILDETNKFLDEDETLYGTIMIKFQMKVLEQLFLFCNGHNASELNIYMDDEQAEGFGIYQEFLSNCAESLAENRAQAEIAILTNPKTFANWCAFMKETNIRLDQDLWREQRSNPAIRRYLKSCANI
ncbi:MAG: hypothetical protein ACOH2E_01090 [Candidatus Paracaedibacter sp.]